MRGAIVAPFLFLGVTVTRACIFVDGENFRFSLVDLFATGEYSFTREDYLPQTDWYQFFVGLAWRFDCDLLRTYWYVVDTIDFRPRRIPYHFKEKKGVFCRFEKLRKRITSSKNEKQILIEIDKELKSKRKIMEGRAKSWKNHQSNIEHHNRQIEFRASGSIPFILPDNRFETEKGVDTQMTTDLITMAHMYDVAIILSGDADYIPPARAIKHQGKLVYGISFLNKNGKRLPGGAWRLDNLVDHRYEIPFDEMFSAMNISTVAESSDAVESALT